MTVTPYERSSSVDHSTNLEAQIKVTSDPVAHIPETSRTRSHLHELPKWQKITLWTGVFLSAYAAGVDTSTLWTYINNAMADFGVIVQYTTLVVVQACILAAGRGPFARLSDIFGRPFLWITSILFLFIGLVLITTSNSFNTIAPGVVFFSLGTCGFALAQNVLIADLVAPRYRALVTNILSIETIVNFASGPKIAGKMIPDRWRWGVSISAFLMPATAAPVIFILLLQQRAARKKRGITGGVYKGMSLRRTMKEFALDLDPLGLLCFAGGFLLVLLPLTIASLAPHGYQTGYIIAMLVVGGVLLLLWPVVELKVPRPLVNFRTFFVNPNILLPAAIYFIDEFSFAMSYTPILQWSEITFGWNAGNATYFAYTQSASTIIFGIIAGLIVARTGRYKWVTVSGSCIRLLGLGLMFHYRKAGSSIAQVVLPQVIQGLGGGFMTANLIVAAQASVPHSQIAIVTGFMYTVVPVGSSIGAAIVGNIQAKLLSELHKYVDPVAGNTTLAVTIYKGGSTALAAYPLGTAVRTAAIEAWSENVKLILTAAMIVAAINIIPTLLLPDRILGREKQGDDEEGNQLDFIPPLSTEQTELRR